MSQVKRMTKANDEWIEIVCHIAGTRYHELWKLWGDIKLDDPLVLVREPTNEYDENAVKIEYPHQGKQVMIGYIPKKVSAEVSEMVIKGATCKIIEYDKDAPPSRQVVIIVKRED